MTTIDNGRKRTLYQKHLERGAARAREKYPVIEVGVPMRDGVELAADVHLPHRSERPAPAIVTITPYDKRGHGMVVAEAEFFQRHGYAYVAVDCRGRGKSEGAWRAFVNDPADGHDVVEWAARQPWCTGKVGMTGLSYNGWTAWAAASERPPSLTCLVATSPAGRWHQEIPSTDGCFQLYFAWWVYIVRRRIAELASIGEIDWDQVLRTLPIRAIGDVIDPSGETWADLMEHDTLDAHWQAIRFDDRYDRIDIPALHVTGWFDLEDLPGAFHHYEHMMAASPARGTQRLIVGPWSHGQARMPHWAYGGLDFGDAAAVDMNHVHKRWFDHWLKGIDSGALAEAPVQLFETGTNRWRDETAWPLATATRALHLRWDGATGGLSETAGPEEPERRYRYDPEDPVPTRLDVRGYPREEVPLAQNDLEARVDVLAWTSEALAEPLTLSGWPHVDLWAASDCDDTEWHVRLTDVWPDGRSIKVAQGCLRASWRGSRERPTPLVPGEPTRFDVELWPAHHVFLPGHRVRVTVTSSDFPWYARSLNRFGPLADQAEPRVATNTVFHGGAHASRLLLPVEEGVRVR